MSNITTQSLTSLVNKIKNKELSSEEVTKAFIARSEKSKELNSYISEDFSNAIDKAKNTLHMKIGRNAKGVNHLRIKLTGADLYDMEFLQVRAGNVKVKAKEKGVYNDQLQKMFTKHTGMYTSL